MKEPNHKYIANLVVRTQHNDSDAFAELYGLTYNKVYNYCHHYLRDSYLAQDAVQEIYILALKNICKLNDPTLFIAWLNQISFRVCYDMCKKNSESYGNVTDPELLDIVKDEKIDTNPEAHTEQEDEYTRLRTAIENLPPNERQVIVLRYFNDMKIDDIASTMDISKSSVKRYLASGQNTLRKRLHS